MGVEESWFRTDEFDFQTREFSRCIINNKVIMRTDLLKQILAVPTKTNTEHQMVAFLAKYCKKHGINFVTDEHRNCYIVKGIADCYPCVMAHTDSVHSMNDKTIKEDNGILRAYNKDDQQIGIGGDDICGIFICLELLEAFDTIKVALFAGEERGCIGSRQANPLFFRDVGYAMEFDSPGSDTMSYSNSGVKMFADDGEFITKALPSLDRYGVTKWQNHPWTDTLQIREKFGFQCLNLPAGYYRFHTPEEYVVLADVQNSILLGHELISTLGNRSYYAPVERTSVKKASSPRPIMPFCSFPDSPLLKV